REQEFGAGAGRAFGRDRIADVEHRRAAAAAGLEGRGAVARGHGGFGEVGGVVVAVAATVAGAQRGGGAGQAGRGAAAFEIVGAAVADQVEDARFLLRRARRAAAVAAQAVGAFGQHHLAG